MLVGRHLTWCCECGAATYGPALAYGLSNLGTSYSELGQTQRAIDLYNQALSIARETGDQQCEAMVLCNLGNCYAVLGQTHRATELADQALTLARQTGDQQCEANVLANLGNYHATLGRTQQATDLHNQALSIAQETGNRGLEARCLAIVGDRYADLGRTQQAIDLYNQALTLAQETGDRGLEARCLHGAVIERTRAGLAAAAANGRKGGRPRKVDAADAAKARSLRDKGITATDIAKMLGVSRATVYRYLTNADPVSA